MDDPATSQALTHLTNITGFLRGIADELKTINQRAAAKEARKAAKKAAKGSAKPRGPQSKG